MSEEITTLTKAAGGRKSLRTTVPIFIVKLLKLQEGDKLQWETKLETNGKVTIALKPIRQEQPQQVSRVVPQKSRADLVKEDME